MPVYRLDVELTQTYTVQVEAETSDEARRMVDEGLYTANDVERFALVTSGWRDVTVATIEDAPFEPNELPVLRAQKVKFMRAVLSDESGTPEYADATEVIIPKDAVGYLVTENGGTAYVYFLGDRPPCGFRDWTVPYSSYVKV